MLSDLITHRKSKVEISKFRKFSDGIFGSFESFLTKTPKPRPFYFKRGFIWHHFWHTRNFFPKSSENTSITKMWLNLVFYYMKSIQNVSEPKKWILIFRKVFRPWSQPNHTKFRETVKQLSIYFERSITVPNFIEIG